jgi:guanosine-3',5'-bis(diphosphate) 3'-pyrophosphohydrolase
LNAQYTVGSVDVLLHALAYAAEKHQYQRRKGEKKQPYINHPIRVATLLWDVGHVREMAVLVAALLHDTLEDTDASPEEIADLGGKDVLNIVQEVSDDKSLPKQVRKQLQIEHSAVASHNAKLIKIADKICNVYDLCHEPPAGWSRDRLVEYLDWAELVVSGARGTNLELEQEFDRVLAEARSILTMA